MAVHNNRAFKMRYPAAARSPSAWAHNQKPLAHESKIPRSILCLSQN